MLQGQFRQFDHGTHKNLVVYGTPTPPAYNLSLIEAPVSMYVGKNDEIMNVDVSLMETNDFVFLINFFNILGFENFEKSSTQCC